MYRSILIVFIVLICFGCEKERIKREAGENTVFRNGECWNGVAITTYEKADGDIFDLILNNTIEENPPPWGRIAFYYLPLQEGIIDIQYFEPYENIPTAVYTHTLLYETSDLGNSSLWETYPEQHFEITSVSKNQRRVAGFFNLAFIVDNPATTAVYNEPDTNYFEGNFEVLVRK